MMLYEREFAGNYDVRSERGAVRRASALRVVSGVASRTTFRTSYRATESPAE